MADRLFACYWLRDYSTLNMLRHFEKMVRLFPLLPQHPSNLILHVHAISFQEPPLSESEFSDPLNIAELIAAAREFLTADVACQLDAWWGLWQYRKEWELRPARINLSCFGPEFDSPEGEHLRIDFGLDSNFLPRPELPGSARFVESNLKGLLKLVHTLDEALAAERRLLLTESGENFADKLRLSAADL